LKGYIDLHLHILPGLDDGPGDLETAEETARILVEQGFKAAVATPHCCEGRPSPAEIRSRLEQLQERLLRKNIHLQVYPGSELMMDPHLLERLEREESLTLAGSRYFLVEFPLHQPLPLNTRELLSQALVRGFIPVLAHPERTQAFAQKPERLAELVRAGCLVQLSTGSLAGLFGSRVQRFSRWMLEQRLVHFLATDGHGTGRRLAATGKGIRELIRLQGRESTGLFLQQRPSRVLTDELFAVPEPGESAPRSGLNGFFKTVFSGKRDLEVNRRNR